MDFVSTLAISASALSAERMRLDAIASNLANASTTRTARGGPYRRREVVFEAAPVAGDFSRAIEAAAARAALRGVKVAGVVEDPSPPKMVFDPGHPDANADGYVAYPDINVVTELIDLMAATRAYEANVQAMNATKRMVESALSIGSGR